MKGIYFAGNFLSKTIKGTRAMYEEVAERFFQRGWFVVTASSFKNRILRMIDYLWTALRFRRKYQVASVAVFSDLAFRWSEMLCFLLRMIKKPYILSLHGGKLPEFARKNLSRVSKLLGSAQVVTTPSKYLYQNFLSIRPDLNYVPNGIEIKNYPFVKVIHVKPHLIWLRSFHQIYQPEMAIEVMNRLINEFPDATLKMIGPDKKDGSLEKTKITIDHYDLDNNIQIINAISKAMVPKFLSEGCIFLNTTKYESFGVSVLEAAACGLCIVTTNAGELPYMWEDGVDALVVPIDNPESMASAVNRILTEPGLAEKLSRNARAKAEKYDWSVVLPQWEALFKEVINQNYG